MGKVFFYFLSFFCGVLMLGSCKTAKLSDALKKHALGEYYDAAAIYRKVYTKTPAKNRTQRGLVAFNMGECYRLINNPARAASSYRNAVRYKYPDSSAVFYLAQMLHKCGQYSEAIKQYQVFLDSFPDHALSKMGIEGCRMAPIWKGNPSSYRVQRMELFNSRRGEFCPMFLGPDNDLLYFTSCRESAIGDKKSPITGFKNNDFFMVKKDENGKWLQPESIDDGVNTEFDEGVGSFTPDGNTMYYTYCGKDNSVAKTAEIRSSARSGAKWGQGQRIEITKDTFSVFAHPAVSPMGDYLYFVSDMPGGFGGKDIWRAAIIGTNDFGYVENLGPEINTAGDEMFPYVHSNGNLYFSSNGWAGMGGLDIFIAEMDSTTGSWRIENMGYPINSAGDDFGITFGTGGDFGYFSSNRNDGRGADHIYAFERPTYSVILEGFVSDNDDEPIADATVRLVGKDGSIEKFVSRKDGSYRATLKRGTEYVMMASARGYLNKMKRLKTRDEDADQLYYADFFLPSITKPVLIENIFYDFDKATLRPESEAALDEVVEMLNDNPNVTIELSSHTDRKGSDEYNDGLSQRRAQSVVDYVCGKGITPDRLSPVGYGEKSPKVINKKMAEKYPFLKEGDVLTEEFILSLSPEEQEIADQINRRTEFKVLRTNYRLF